MFDGKIYQKFGSDNLFPQAIASLTRKSPIHRGVLNYKRVFIGGKGFNFDEGNQQLEAVIKRANTRESLSQVLKKIILDKSEFGNGFMENVCKSISSRRDKNKTTERRHRSSNTSRLGKRT